MPGLVRIGRIFGIPISVHWSLVLIAAFLGAGLAGGYLPDAAPGGTTSTYWVAAGAGVLGFFASILGHELAHAVTARRFGVGTESIELWLLGGVARLRSDSPSPRADAAIASAGPAASLLLGVLGVAGAFAVDALGAPPIVSSLVFWLGLVNGALAVFNLLPGAPLDGGRILRAWRWWRCGDRLRATADAARAGQVLGWIVVIVGGWLVVNGWGTLFLPMTGVFLIISAKAELRAAYTEARLAGVRVQDVTWFGVAQASDDTDAETMLWQRDRLGTPRVVAVQGPDGRLTGLVAEDQLWRIPEVRRASVRLAQLVVPFVKVTRAEADEPLAEVLPRLNPVSPLITVWRGERLVGVVTPDALTRRLREAGGF